VVPRGERARGARASARLGDAVVKRAARAAPRAHHAGDAEALPGGLDGDVLLEAKGLAAQRAARRASVRVDHGRGGDLDRSVRRSAGGEGRKAFALPHVLDRDARGLAANAAW
jgi:hypothetical protein